MHVVVLVTQVTLRALRRAFWVINFRDLSLSTIRQYEEDCEPKINHRSAAKEEGEIVEEFRN